MTRIILPGLVDVHTHMRVPGGEHKEDFATGTAAALAGGFTTILAMPNTNPPLSSAASLKSARELAQETAHCDVGLFAGANPGQIDQLVDCAPMATALKIYLNETYGPLRVEELSTLESCFSRWPSGKIIAMHAEGQSVAVGIGLAAVFDRHVHFCHISRQEEIELIAAAKDRGLPVSCEVAPHHLTLSEVDADRLGPYGQMRPPLAKPSDVQALWDHLNSTIDCIATDHAPHTRQEKMSDSPPPGVPGLESALPLMLTAVHEGRLSLERLVELMSVNPREIFDLPEQPETRVEIDPDAAHILTDERLFTKCGWSPFAGAAVRGRVERVILRGQTVYEGGQMLAQPGSGRILLGSDQENQS